MKIKPNDSNIFKKIAVLFTVFVSTVVYSQTYPVQVTPQLIPPYSLKMSDYATTTSEKLYTNILLTDVNEVGRRIRLKMYIEGQGLSITTRDVITGETAIYLDGGINLRLSNVDLQAYFQLNNLVGITPGQYNAPLPNGGYDFCFEVYDYFTNRKLSSKSCTTVYLLQNDPPILNLPFKDNIVNATNPQNVLFTWTPRHSNASNVQYEFTLKELWDVQNPQANFLASVPFYQTNTYSTTLLVGPEAPQLLSGKIYGWQVRAFVSDGISETSVFKNDGNSEIFWFKYLEDCQPPSFVISQALTAESVQVNWQSSEHVRYRIQYRKKGFGDDDWFEVNGYTNEGKIRNLEPATVYEFRVGGECTQLSGFAYSNIQEFTTPSNDEAAYYNCGLTPQINITNKEPLPKLGINETFTAGDFPVTTREVTGSNGRFSGWGYITLPFLENLKEIIDAANIATGGKVNIGKYTRIKVVFDNVQINNSYELIDGVVETDYDPDWKGIIDTDEIIDDIGGDRGNIENFDATNTDIKDVKVDENGNVVIIPEVGEPIPIETGKPVTITDKNGDQWTVHEDGKVTEGKVAEGGTPTVDNTEGISSSGNVKQISSKDVRVTFNPSGYYGTDTYQDHIKSDKYKSEYEFIKTHDNEDYSVLYKLLSDLPEHKTDIIKATVHFSNGKTKDDIVFKTKEGTAISPTWSGNEATLPLQRKFEFAKEEILATVKPKDSTGKYTVAGKLNVWHAQQQTINLTLVSVDGASVSNVGDRINEIYNKAGIHFNIKIEIINLGLGNLDVGDSDMLSNYTEGEKSIISTFKNGRTIAKNQYYMFFLDDKKVTLTKDLDGFMPLKRQFGFVFTKQDAGRVAAHELGHGIFGLKHPFDQYDAESAKNENHYLMSYGTGTAFSHMDWQKLHAPGIQLYWFQGDEIGQHESYEYYASKVVVPNVFISNLNNYNKNTVSFVSSSGKLITLPSTVMDVTFHKKGDGTLFAFTLEENGKKVRYVSAVRYRGTEKENFAGYLKSFNVSTYKEWEENVYQDNFSVMSSFPKSNVDVYLGKLNNEPCGINLYKATLNNTTSGKWNSGGNEESLTSKNYTEGATKITKNVIESPTACNFCDKGKEFFELHASVNDEEILQVVRDISDLICDPEADTSFFDEFSEKGYDNLLAWQKKFYDEGTWKNDLEAYKAFYEAYKRYLDYYFAAKAIITTSSDKEALLRVAYNLSLTQLENLTAQEKLSMLAIMTKGFVGGYWFGGNYNIEALALKVIKSVNNKKEKKQIQKFLEGLVSDTYKVDNKFLYENLFKKIDDYFGKDNFTELILRFTNFALETNSETNSLLPIKWGVKNSSFLLNYMVSGSDFEFDYKGDKVYVTGECLEKQYTVNRHGERVETGCEKYKYENLELHPFNDFVTLTIIENTNILPTFMCGSPDVQWCGKAIKVPAVFLPYLQEKKSTQSFENWGINTITIVGTVMSFGEVAAARAAGQMGVAYWAISDLGYTFSTPVVNLIYEKIDDKTDNKEFKDYFKSGWDAIGYVFLAKSAADITGLTAITTKRQIARGYAAIKTYGEDEFFEIFEKSLKEASAELAEEQIKAISKDVKNSIKKLEEEIPDLINEELQTAQKILSKKESFTDLLKKSLIEKLGTNSEYANFKNWINKLEEGDILNKLDKISARVDSEGINDLNRLRGDFDNLLNKGIDFNDIELLSAWSSLSKSPIIRSKPENLIILKKVHSRFEYLSLSSFDGLNKLLNEGSSASKQKLINGLKEVDGIFPKDLPIKFSGIKAGDVKVINSIDDKGDEVARYVDGILQKKKVIPDGDDVKLVKKGETPDEDLLKKNEELGYRRIAQEANLASYTKLRSHLGSSRVKQYLNNEELRIFEKTIKRSNPEVLEFMNKLDEFDFAEVVRGYRDLKRNEKLGTFDKAISSIEDFSGKYGWYNYWKVTPGMKYSLTTIEDLKSAGLILPTGKATDIQLASIQAFTRKGDFINVPMRYNKSFLGEYAEKGFIHVKECLEELRKISSRDFKGKTVVSGKTFTKSDFESKFVNGVGKNIEYDSFISTTTKQTVAEGFTKLTVKWAGDGEKVAVIQRIVSKDGVYIDDLSDWGANLGPSRHANEPVSIQVQDEVLLSPSRLEQTGEPIPVMENGQHKLIYYNENGVEKAMKVYYVDFKQI
ncbi:fibronectin type III domain protein [Tenacibaculum gallaicum]|uniref:Fibronectin type III domain protein n=1 Tax=Tenacibaculum gallaicum TaxID=561505 RepID=A0A3E0HFA2_9FLAO|nr:fibronectin type III domain-containing protein [Tenacibaculum gallaicum]REH44485.1 fibronectin type III domain protein [Tenacibaculum gallaicum]